MNVKELIEYLRECDPNAEVWISDENGTHPFGCLLQKSDFKKTEYEGFDQLTFKILPLYPVLEIGMFDIYRRSNMSFDYGMSKYEMYKLLTSRNDV
jgi:hypothetical protein